MAPVPLPYFEVRRRGGGFNAEGLLMLAKVNGIEYRYYVDKAMDPQPPDPRDCRCCGALYLGPTCRACMRWQFTGVNEMRAGLSPMFTLTPDQILAQVAKVIACR